MNLSVYLTSLPIWENAADLWKRYRRPFLILYVYSLIIYLPMLVLRLTNHIDGLWNQDDYLAGVWELSIGRWFWPWLDRLRFGNSLDPMPGILSLAIYVAAFLVILSILQVEISWLSYLAGFLFLSNTAITCQMSHGYMVITFSLSTLLSVLAVRVLARRGGRKTWRNILLSAVLIAVMLGCYQAEIGITCLVALFHFLMTLAGYGKKRKTGSNPSSSLSPVREAFSFAGRMLAALVLGALLYEILLQIHLKAFDVEMNSYQAFSEISPVYFIAHLPEGIGHAYRMMKTCFLDSAFQFNALQTKVWFPILYVIPAAALIFAALAAFRRSRAGGLWYLAGAVLIPVFAGSFYLLAPEAETHMQMLSSYFLIIPLLLCQYQWIELPIGRCGRNAAKGRISEAGADYTKDDAGDENAAAVWPADREESRLGDSDRKRGRAGMAGRNVFGAVFLAEAILLVWGSIGMTLTDQYAMYAGRTASATIAEDILSRAEGLGQDFLNGQILILGTPAQSAVFSVGDLYYDANSYAQYGNWSENVGYGRLSWSALYDNYLRVNVTFSTGDTESTIVALPEVEAMPVYPASGSIQNIYGVTVVKIGDIYNY